MTPDSPAPILVAGIGNIFLGDDAFGVEVAKALVRTRLPSEAVVKDYGIRGLDLAYALLNPWRAVILVDAIALGGTPGDVYVLQPDNDPEFTSTFDPHGMHPLQVLAMARSIGEITAPIYIVGCEPQSLGAELEGRMGLSPVVQHSIAKAVGLVDQLLNHIQHGETCTIAELAR
jgi:hydrogenase maturation protease